MLEDSKTNLHSFVHEIYVAHVQKTIWNFYILANRILFKQIVHFVRILMADPAYIKVKIIRAVSVNVKIYCNLENCTRPPINL